MTEKLDLIPGWENGSFFSSEHPDGLWVLPKHLSDW